MGTRVIGGGEPTLALGQTPGTNQTALRVDAGAALETSERPYQLHPTDSVDGDRWTVTFEQTINTNVWIAGSDSHTISTYPRPPQTGSDNTTPTRVRLRLITPQTNPVVKGFIIGRSAAAGSNGDKITMSAVFDSSGYAQDTTFVMGSTATTAVLSSGTPNSGLAPMSVIDQVVVHGNFTGPIQVQIGTSWNSGTGTLTYTTAWTIDPLKNNRAAICYAIPGAGFSPNQRLVVERVSFTNNFGTVVRLMQCPQWLLAAGPAFSTSVLQTWVVQTNSGFTADNLNIVCGGSSMDSFPAPNTSSPWSTGWGAVYLEITRNTANITDISGNITFRLVRSPTDVPA